MSKVVPFKDWNDIVKDDRLPDFGYKVKLYRRPTAKVNPVVDATLTPITPSQESAQCFSHDCTLPYFSACRIIIKLSC